MLYKYITYIGLEIDLHMRVSVQQPVYNGESINTAAETDFPSSAKAVDAGRLHHSCGRAAFPLFVLDVGSCCACAPELGTCTHG